jgi:hypothetical protein
MRAQGLCGRPKARYRVRTTDSNHAHPIAPNRLATEPKATGPNQIWVQRHAGSRVKKNFVDESNNCLNYLFET